MDDQALQDRAELTALQLIVTSIVTERLARHFDPLGEAERALDVLTLQAKKIDDPNVGGNDLDRFRTMIVYHAARMLNTALRGIEPDKSRGAT